ncbi:hypothetical protein [Streptococcus uberis]
MSDIFDDVDSELANGKVPERSPEMDRAMIAMRDIALVTMRKARAKMAQMEATLLAYMDEHACDLEISDTERLYVGQTKTTKSVDDQGILMAILEAGGGNLELLTTGDGGMLASQPWKAGAVRDLIGDNKFSACFETTVKIDLKTGKPARSVKVADQRFGA